MATLFRQHTNPANLSRKGKKLSDNWNARYLDAIPSYYLNLDLSLKYKKEPDLDKYRKIVVLVN